MYYIYAFLADLMCEMKANFLSQQLLKCFLSNDAPTTSTSCWLAASNLKDKSFVANSVSLLDLGEKQKKRKKSSISNGEHLKNLVALRPRAAFVCSLLIKVGIDEEDKALVSFIICFWPNSFYYCNFAPHLKARN